MVSPVHDDVTSTCILLLVGTKAAELVARMSRRLLAVGFLVAAAIAGGCQHASPQLHVLGVQSSALREVVFVQVTNPTSRGTAALGTG